MSYWHNGTGDSAWYLRNLNSLFLFLLLDFYMKNNDIAVVTKSFITLNQFGNPV